MKQQLDMKRLILLNLPYVFAFYFVDKVAAVFRLAPGSAFVEKLTGGFANFGTAFANPLPSFQGEPKLVEIPDDMDAFTDMLWNSLNEDNKVSLFVRCLLYTSPSPRD